MQFTTQERSTIEAARNILRARVEQYPLDLSHIDLVADFLKMQLADCTEEKFVVLYLTGGLHLIEYAEPFHGTMDTVFVHYRVIARRAMELNARFVLVAHNHGNCPIGISSSDCEATADLKQVLKLIDVELIDHIVVCHDEFVSFAKEGML